MLPFLADHHGDPGRVHAEGHVTRVAVEHAREQVAAALGARPREVVFTSSGTEAVNAAVFGAIERGARSDRSHVVATAVEHSSVLDACRRSRVDLTVVGVDRDGAVDAEEVIAAVRDDTVLVNVQFANHEVGTIQPAAAVAKACRDHDALVHVDACAATGYTRLDFDAIGCDLLTVTAHKLGGPKGAGALLVRRGLRVEPFIVGGAQERTRRGGIENVPAIVGFGAAIEEAAATLDAEHIRLLLLTERLVRDVQASVEGISIFGDPAYRLPHLVCLGVDGVEAEPVLLALDQRGVAVHSGSSCSSETLEPSPVLEAMGVDADHSLRISAGWSSTDADVDAFLDAFPSVVDGLRALRS